MKSFKLTSVLLLVGLQLALVDASFALGGRPRLTAKVLEATRPRGESTYHFYPDRELARRMFAYGQTPKLEFQAPNGTVIRLELPAEQVLSGDALAGVMMATFKDGRINTKTHLRDTEGYDTVVFIGPKAGMISNAADAALGSVNLHATEFQALINAYRDEMTTELGRPVIALETDVPVDIDGKTYSARGVLLQVQGAN